MGAPLDFQVMRRQVGGVLPLAGGKTAHKPLYGDFTKS